MEKSLTIQVLEVNNDIMELLELIKIAQNAALNALKSKKLDYGYLGDFKQTRSDLEDIYARLSADNNQ